MYVNWPMLIILLPAMLFGLLCLVGGFLMLVLIIYAWFCHEQKERQDYRGMQKALVKYAETLARDKK